MVLVNAGVLRPETVISLRDVDELCRWDEGYIGAGVSYARLEQSGVAALAELSRTVGSPQIRQAGTIGGNLGTASPAGDALPFLAAVDATVELRSLGETRILPWNEFLTGPKQNARRSNELIVGVHLESGLPERSAFAKIGVRQAMVISIASVCVTRRSDGNTTVAMGAVGPTVLRAGEAEQLVSGDTQPSEAVFAEFERLVSEAAAPITDHRSTAEYRRRAVGVIARRALQRCLA